MKIYGQDFTDVLRRLPWQYQIVVAAGSLFIVITVIHIAHLMMTLKLKPEGPSIFPAKIASQQKMTGSLDPSLAYDTVNKRIFMAYTSQEDTKNGPMMSTRLAMNKVIGAAACKEWLPVTGADAGFEAKKDTILAPDGQTVLRSGVWHLETPALVYDPDDHGHEWKLYAYKYFWPDNPKDSMSVIKHYGVIVYKSATDPFKEWTPEQWLFSPAENYPPAPYGSMVLLQLNRLDASLKDVTAYTRPSAVYKDGALVMTFSAFTDGTAPDRIVMISSADHGNSWRYVGTLLQKSDLRGVNPADKTPYTQIAGATLIEQEGKVYLAAVLGDEKQFGQGTFIFGFDDFANGVLHRDPATGVPAVLHQLPLPKPSLSLMGGGAAAYSDGCNLGLMQTEEDGVSPNFKIYQTKVKPVENVTPNK